ncbi:tetratricopeptide repeat protein [Methylobacterium sp. WL64]|uniref:adenylate/guanylate cyclase domain-containing protein n=1 Tax=Methylobacterium sp. WL64 TaxID=2603894 RepID=UPI0011CA33D1|nr:tetratricopeptide repeat protein [Methylobacterium sp. WL64]TXN01746.1 tetratricopeptide repeat protein [Methylobacterium sp. WL64]
MSENTERSTASEWSVPERRLAAIFAADIAGYSRAMHADESGAMRALQAMRMIVDRLILARRGRIANTAGDSVLAEFASVTDAVCCAVAIQRALAEADGDAGQFRLRIGIHIGDIMVHAGDLFGDGVNIAARLQTAADPGALRLSEAAYLQVRGLPDIRFIDLGPQRLKNIARPLRVYAVPPPDGQPWRNVQARRARAALRPTLGAAAVLAAAAGLAMAWPHLVGSEQWEAPRVPARPRLSLVVLPLTNQSGDTDQDYLAEQLAEDLSADLARAPGTFVIAHGTAQSYKGRQSEPRTIGRELGVRYVVQGSLRHSAEQVRFAVQLTDVETGASLWADHYDRPRAAVGATQDVLVTQVGRALGVRLLEAATRARSGQPVDAVDLVMRGQALLNRPFARENHAQALPLFERALKLDPENVDARLGMAEVLVDGALNGWTTERTADLEVAERAIASVLQGDPTHPFAHYLRGETLRARSRYSEALAAFDRVLTLNQSFARAHAYRGLIHIFLGRAEETERDIAAAIRLSPKDPLLGAWLAREGLAKLHLGQDQEAIAPLRRAAAVNPLFDFPHLYLACAFARLDRDAEARASLAEFLKLRPGYTLARYRGLTSTDPNFLAQRERIYDGLRRAGLPER